jgi:hypothetical protein
VKRRKWKIKERKEEKKRDVYKWSKVYGKVIKQTALDAMDGWDKMLA